MDVAPLDEKERVDFFLASGWRFSISQVIDSKRLPSLFQGICAGGQCGPICSISPASFTAIGWYVSPSSVVLSSVTSSSSESLLSSTSCRIFRHRSPGRSEEGLRSHPFPMSPPSAGQYPVLLSSSRPSCHSEIYCKTCSKSAVESDFAVESDS